MFLRQQQAPSAQASSSGPSSYVFGGLAGVADFFLFHPFDTAIRRMQNAQQPRPTMISQLISHYKHVIFNGMPANSSLFSRICSLYAGAPWAFMYKVTARGYKFGTQPLLEGVVRDHYGNWLNQHVDGRCVNPLIKAISASIIGMGEFIFAPLDAIVVRYQGTETRPVSQIVRSEGMNLYKGCNWTAARNGVGSFFLFSIPAFVSAAMTDRLGKTHVWQEGFANFIGGLVSTAATNPIDVVKTRVQTRGGNTTGSMILREIIHQEGIGALFKGVTIRVVSVAPRLALIKTVAEALPLLWAQYATAHQSAQDNRPSAPGRSP